MDSSFFCRIRLKDDFSGYSGGFCRPLCTGFELFWGVVSQATVQHTATGSVIETDEAVMELFRCCSAHVRTWTNIFRPTEKEADGHLSPHEGAAATSGLSHTSAERRSRSEEFQRARFAVL